MFVGAKLDKSNGNCFFRVWAPNAKDVQVVLNVDTGPFTFKPLAKQSNGYWEAVIPGLSINDQYKLLLEDHKGNKSYRLDPAAKDTHHSGLDNLDQPGSNACLITDPDYNWKKFNTPRFNNFIIYQLHIGTFAGYNDKPPINSSGIAKIKNIECKLSYIQEMGFDAIELLPIHEFRGDRSWGYNPSHFFAPESHYGSPEEYKHFINEAHDEGLAVILDVVYNHVSDDDNGLWKFDETDSEHRGIYQANYRTPWGSSFAFWKEEVKNFFFESAEQCFEVYNADGLRFDATRYIEYNRGWGDDGWEFMQYLTYCLKQKYPDKYLIAEHLPDHESIINSAGFHATWYADSHHEFQRAANGDDSINRLKRILGKDFGYGKNYPNQWNLVKYLLGSHDDCGDDKDGNTINKSDWEQHRYFVELFGGRDNWHARAKARLGWALNIAIAGTPLLFMGGECHHWGYWHDYKDDNGDHRFNWDIAGDPTGAPMKRLVTAANWVRWNNPALRSETLEIVHENYNNSVIAFKRWVPGGNNVVLTIVNIGDSNFYNHEYGVDTGGQYGQWTQILCSQDSTFGGWDGAGNAYHEPYTEGDGKIYISLPKWSVIMMRLK